MNIRACSVAQCNAGFFAAGLCRNHHKNEQKYGYADVSSIEEMRAKNVARFK